MAAVEMLWWVSMGEWADSEPTPLTHSVLSGIGGFVNNRLGAEAVS